MSNASPQETVLGASFPSVAEIYNRNTVDLVVQVKSAAETGAAPSLVAAQALLSRVVEEMQEGYLGELPHVPWPVSPDTLRVKASNPYFTTDRHARSIHAASEIGVKVTIGTSGRETYLGKTPTDVLFDSTLHAVKNLAPYDQAEFITWMAKLIDVVPPFELEGYVPDMLQFIANSPNAPELFTHILDYAYQHADEYYAGVQYQGRTYESHAYEVVWKMGYQEPYRELALKSLSLGTDDDRTHRILGMLINESNYAETLNSVQNLIKAHPETSLAKRMERIGRMLLGRGPDEDIPFLTASHELYNKFHLDLYTYLEQELPQDLEVFEQVLAQINKSPGIKGTVVELGSGTGRFLNAGAKRFPNESFIGIEILPEYAHLAKKRDTTGRVRYVVADIENTGISDGEAKLVASFARTLNALDRDRLIKVVREGKRLGKRIVFSYADGQSPKYEQDKLYFWELLKGLGIPRYIRMTKEEAVKELDVIISSSDGVHWVSRYVYPDEELAHIFQQAGMKLTKLKTVDIPGLAGARSNYFFAEASDVPVDDPDNER